MSIELISEKLGGDLTQIAPAIEECLKMLETAAPTYTEEDRTPFMERAKIQKQIEVMREDALAELVVLVGLEVNAGVRWKMQQANAPITRFVCLSSCRSVDRLLHLHTDMCVCVCVCVCVFVCVCECVRVGVRVGVGV
jgi:hypothetical protein